jgi:uncharacterized protein (TIGR02217 family)
MSYPVMSTSVPWSLVKSGFRKTPSFTDGTLRQKSPTGRRSSLTLKPFATWNFELDLNFVLGGECAQYSVLQMFLGCFLATCGGGSFFLFRDPNDNTVDDTGLNTPQSCMMAAPLGALQQGQTTGDGVTTQFQLARLIDQGVDILQQVSNVAIFINGNAALDGSGNPTFTVSAGVVTFTTAPGPGAVLTWTGNFQYLCQFTEDSLKDLARVSKNANGFLWSCGSVAFESVFV